MSYLFILSDTYPFSGETFLGNEIQHIKDTENCFIVPLFASANPYGFPDNKNPLPCLQITETSNAGWSRLSKLGFLFWAVSSKVFWEELLYMVRRGKLEIYNVLRALHFIAVGEERYSKIRKLIKEKVGENEQTTFYSYWMYVHSYVAVRLKQNFPNSRCVTRCHGYDLYEYRSQKQYLPCRKFIFEHMDRIFTISENGQNYLKHIYSSLTDNKTELSRLGTLDHGVNPKDQQREGNILKIVSCSNLVKVKRIDRLINALAKIKDLQIEWVHFGDGPLAAQLKIQAKSLPANIRWNFAGAISNGELMAQYRQNHFDVFINVSESEGIPVSVMEVLSFGIPAIVTDVGGLSEIVEDGCNGYLLNPNFTSQELVALLYAVYRLPNDKYNSLRQNARAKWEKEYNAEENYARFWAQMSKS